MFQSVITGSGSYIPTEVKKNSDFLGQQFYANDAPLTQPAEQIIKKFQQITGIDERRYVLPELTISDIGYLAAEAAILDAGIDQEEIDQIIVAHNFGDMRENGRQSVMVPAIACNIKQKLGILNPNCIAYDLIFGCPGWLQGVIQMDGLFKAGIAQKALIIGAETLSRVIDKYDRDSMIFSDGAGAVILESVEMPQQQRGILSSCAQTYAYTEVDYINMGKSFSPVPDPETMHIKMNGRKVYEFALLHVPHAMKLCLDKSGRNIMELKKIFIHQANEKMDEAIIERFYDLYGITEYPKDVLPMSIQWLGNSSVATIPTLYDLVLKHKIPEHTLEPGDLIMFASVGAGMNINAVCYRY
ncbi:3-oxoacyl-[acyl-carrier-protein] synthase-3 [Chitinophaga polysaccharea]|uniref:3-oxoacyl-[acyl-carrier-protein] synthase-3 n=1 Tax=Chitinophaga polysaccharea TaxID=1293035 RepID=A0A561PP56_9BACT|nr:ketoacyl-ACP synthase III [Chitinophaga polysaccharea]TWF39895.1 3-oxoacyl-[acyl-carrier-protein] synthase-3 [Chitinophaga polysaccharea]